MRGLVWGRDTGSSSRPRPAQTVTESRRPTAGWLVQSASTRPLEGSRRFGLATASARELEMAAFAVRAAISARAACPALPTRRVGSGRRHLAAATEARAAATDDDASERSNFGAGRTRDVAFFATATTRRRLAVAVAAARRRTRDPAMQPRGLLPTWSRTPAWAGPTSASWSSTRRTSTTAFSIPKDGRCCETG